MKKFIAMLTVAAVVFASLGCQGETPKKDKDGKPAPAADKDKKAP